jgi:mRNA-degrading endonuclease toxin of MazEF toxin-antitoxin module
VGRPASADWSSSRPDFDSLISGADPKPSRGAQITRTVHNLPSEVALARSDGMPQQCVVNCDVLITVPKPRLLRRITGLSIAKMADVNQAVRFALDLG